MGNDPMISVIIPVYKVEKYLDRCIASVLKQKFTDYEVVLVDDGSPDNCPAMCDEWAKKDSRIKVLHKENGGVSSARNMGITNAKGKYICFVDSDDTVNTDYLQLLYENIKDADISIGNIFVEGEKDNIDLKFYPGKYSIQEFKNDVKNALNYRLMNSAFNKLYKMDIIRENSMLFDQNIKMGEDLVFNLDYMENTEVISVFDRKIYNYLINDASATRNYKPEYYEQRKYITYRSIQFFQLNSSYNPIKQVTNVNLLLGLVNNEILENPQRNVDVPTLLKLLKENHVLEEIEKIRVPFIKMMIFWRNILALKYGLYDLYIHILKKRM